MGICPPNIQRNTNKDTNNGTKNNLKLLKALGKFGFCPPNVFSFPGPCKSDAGPYLEEVRQVQLHLSILGNRCMHLSIFRHDTSFTVFSYDFPANCQICTCQQKSLSRALYTYDSVHCIAYVGSIHLELTLLL